VIFLTSTHKFPGIYDALARREGKKTTLPTLVSVTGLTETQIKTAIANARRTNPAHAAQIEVVEVGRAWRFRATSDNASPYVSPEEIVKAVEVGAPHIWKRVLAILAANDGAVMTRERIAELSGKDGDEQLTTSQVSNAMLTIMRQPVIGSYVEAVWAGRSWRYRDPAKAAASAPAPAPRAGDATVSPSIRNSVLRYFNQRPGDTLFVDDIAADLGFTRKQVQNAVYGMTHDEKSTIRNDFTIVSQGSAWRYVPNRPASNGNVTPTPEKVPAVAFSAATPNAAVHAQAAPKVTVASHDAPVPTSTLPVSSKAPSNTAGSTDARLFEEIGQASNGDILVQESESKKIYRATEL
jgi:hypothetical protein